MGHRFCNTEGRIMSWAVGFDSHWNRDIGYGVPAYCDAPGCRKEIDRGLSYVCCEAEPRGGVHGCGLYFCGDHLNYYRGDHGPMCARCANYKPPYKRIKPDHPEWTDHKATDPSWAVWRASIASTIRQTE